MPSCGVSKESWCGLKPGRGFAGSGWIFPWAKAVAAETIRAKMGTDPIFLI
jgi:hypothetical protein